MTTMRWITELADSGASRPICVVLCLVVLALWKKLADKDKEISEKSIRIRLLNELVTRTQDLRIADANEHSKQQREMIGNLLKASQGAQPLNLHDVLELDESDFELRSLPRR